ncbi:MAG: hypothetical protein N2596_05150 [Syntrophorhabdaceae bacterium]|nr:hypothetical protein [Syntrophorhabdaceae bacterium]
MKHILIALGDRETIYEDINEISKRFYDKPKNIILSEEDVDVKAELIKRASSLFFEENLVITIVDPKERTLREIKDHLEALKGRAFIIIYFITHERPEELQIDADIVVIEKDMEERIKNKVTAILKKYNKQMTHNAFEIFKEKIRDESVLESELIKLINYIGDKKRIDSKDVRAVTSETHQDNLIALFDAFSKRDKKKVLQIIDNLINTMNTPMDTAILIIHSFIVRQTRHLIHAKEIEKKAAQYEKYNDFKAFFNRWKDTLEIKPSEKRHYLPFQNSYYAYRLFAVSRQFKKEDLFNLFNGLAKIDLGLKKDSVYDKRLKLESGLLEII